MFGLVLSGLEKIINTYLQLDLDTVQRLSRFKNKIIKVQITDWNTEFFILPTRKRLKLAVINKKEPDVTISGTLLNLFKTSYNIHSSSSTLLETQVAIIGDTNISEQIRDTLTSISIDWEEHLSKITGDILAHQIGIQVKHVANVGNFTFKSLRMNIKDFVQNESQFMLSVKEVKSFIQSVTDLQHSVDHIEKRIQHLMTKISLIT